MADKESSLERGEYIIGIAIILAALLVSATIYVGASDLKSAISAIKLAAPAAAAAQQPAAAAQPAAQQNPPGNGQPAIQTLKVDYSKAYFKGKPDASVIMVEYSDFQCPFCGRVAPTVKQIEADYPDMKLVYRHFPLSFHPNAQKAAEAAECAGLQGKFWEMHDAMFADQSKLAVSDLKATAAGIAGMDAAAFNTCLDSGQTASITSKEAAEAQSMGIGGTPGFLIYSAKPKSGVDSKLGPIATKLRGYGVDAAVVKVDGAGYGIVFAGALPYENFKEILDAFY